MQKKRSAYALLKNYSRQRPTLPGTGVPSTIGVGKLNFCVRDGNRCGLSAITTGKSVNLLMNRCA